MQGLGDGGAIIYLSETDRETHLDRPVQYWVRSCVFAISRYQTSLCGVYLLWAESTGLVRSCLISLSKTQLKRASVYLA